MRLLEAYPDWPVLHFGETEVLALVKMGQRLGVRERELKALRARMLDVHQRLRQHWWMPTNSYGLKAVASWLGFRESQPGLMAPGAALVAALASGGSRRGLPRSRQNLRRIFSLQPRRRPGHLGRGALAV